MNEGKVPPEKSDVKGDLATQAFRQGPDRATVSLPGLEQMSDMHVLVVDDEPSFREVLCRMLESAHDVREAGSGLDALRMMAEERPAVVLLDLYLPGLGGMQVLRQMQQDPSLADVPVIVISGMDDVETKVSALEAGANDYMVKPVVREELLARIGVQVRRSAGNALASTGSNRVSDASGGCLQKNAIIDGRYVVTGVLGEGGMGTVYEAIQIQLGRPVAIKVLREGTRGRPHRARRLEREAQIVGSLGHSHICQVHDMGRLDDGSPYVVMEKLEGISLAKRLADKGALPFGDIFLIMDNVLSALEAAHRNNVIHRDIKPGNVFLCRDAAGRLSAKVLDFGMAKMLWTSRETDPSVALGTPVYMAPEQVRGRSVTLAVDIYGSGVTLFEMLSGQKPFRGLQLRDVYKQIVRGKLPDVRALRPDIPDDLVKALAKATAVTVDDRYPNAKEFRRDLYAVSKKLKLARIGTQDSRPWWKKLV
jgi:CheY-like chemotaxis protein